MNLLDLPEQLLDKIEPEPMSGCWLWAGRVNACGYGTVQWHNRSCLAHRVVYQLLIGPIGKPTLDHRCRVRPCVNPDHLRPATMKENVYAPGSRNPANLYSKITHCPRHGTPYFQAKRQRKCRECKREWERSRYERKRRGELKPIGRPPGIPPLFPRKDPRP